MQVLVSNLRFLVNFVKKILLAASLLQVTYLYYLYYLLISECLNGNITIKQANKTIAGEYISSTNETKLIIDMREGDYDFITQKATAILTYWFLDCKYYGQTNDFAFIYNFTSPGVMYEIGALVIVSYSPSMTTTMLTSTTTAVPINMTTVASNATVTNSNRTCVTPITVTRAKPLIKPTTIALPIVASTLEAANISLPYICSNTSFVPPDPNKTYGFFNKKIHVRG